MINQMLNINLCRFLKYLFLILSLILIDSCQKPICLCGVEDPKSNILWIKNHLDRMFCVEVYSMVFEGMEYVILADCPGPDAMEVFYDCSGNKKCEFGGIMGGYGVCTMPYGFTIEYYYSHRKFIFSQDSNQK